MLISWTYRIAGNFRGTKYSWFSWLNVWPRIFYLRMKQPCLPLPTNQAATTKILPTKCINIAEPRIFCPPKITRYTVNTSINDCNTSLDNCNTSLNDCNTSLDNCNTSLDKIPPAVGNDWQFWNKRLTIHQDSGDLTKLEQNSYFSFTSC